MRLSLHKALLCHRKEERVKRGIYDLGFQQSKVHKISAQMSQRNMHAIRRLRSYAIGLEFKGKHSWSPVFLWQGADASVLSIS